MLGTFQSLFTLFCLKICYCSQEMDKTPAIFFNESDLEILIIFYQIFHHPPMANFVKVLFFYCNLIITFISCQSGVYPERKYWNCY